MLSLEPRGPQACSFLMRIDHFAGLLPPTIRTCVATGFREILSLRYDSRCADRFGAIVYIVSRFRPAGCTLVLLGTLVDLSSLASRGESEGARLFSLKIYPVLKAKCFACHGEDPGNLEGDLILLSREGMLEGGRMAGRR